MDVADRALVADGDCDGLGDGELLRENERGALRLTLLEIEPFSVSVKDSLVLFADEAVPQVNESEGEFETEDSAETESEVENVR